jgi:hypothetical protein
MDRESDTGLLVRARAAYRRVVADPNAFGPEAARLVLEAREAEDPEALVAALRAEARIERIRQAHRRAL